METASLVNDVFLRLVNSSDISWNDRVHFFAVSARMMRRFWWMLRAREERQTRCFADRHQSG